MANNNTLLVLEYMAKVFFSCFIFMGGLLGLIHGKGGLNAAYTEGIHIRIAGILGMYVGGRMLHFFIKELVTKKSQETENSKEEHMKEPESKK